MSGPNGETTLLRVLLDAAEVAPDQVLVHVRGDGGERTVTYAQLRDDALRVAGGYRAAGVAPGSCVPVLADRGDDFQAMFWGALAAGLVPVPLAPDARRVLPVWELLGRPPVAVDETTAALLTEFPSGVRPLRLETLRQGRPPGLLPEAAPGDVAFLQFSSGSTGAPKGVELTHACVLANLGQIRTAAALTSKDVVASWMPYFHDMGLIGTHLAPLAARAKQVRLEPLSFAKRPALWLETAARHRATVLSAANFALALATRRIPDEVYGRLDLSAVRLMLVGAEPIAPAVWRRFVAKARASGLDARAPQPVYGLAEATLAVTFPPLGEVAAPRVLDRAALSRGRAVDTAPGPDAVELMDVGQPVPGCEIRIADDTGRPLGDRRVGHVQVRGPQVARGYHEAPDTTAAAFADGWLRTGDLGFLADGRLCVTGRDKDVVFVNGRTFHAPDLEEVAAATPGLPTPLTAVIGSTDPADGTERVVVFVRWPRPPREAAPVLAQVTARVRQALAHDDVRVLPLPPGAFPRTTSGKLRRRTMRERYEAGAYATVEARWCVATPAPAGAVAPPAEGCAEASGTAGGAGVVPSWEEVAGVVAGVWARVLGRPVGSIGVHDRFLAIGGSSLKAMEVLAALEDTFGVSVPPGVLRDRDTVAALTEHLVAAQGGERPESARPRPATGNPGAAVAVVSMACRFPGADTPDAFWDRLVAGHDAVGPVPATRWSTRPGSTARWGAFLADPAGFDAAYFGIDAQEATATDPQARIFLELAHEALERAGYAGARRAGRRVGVFAATGESGYREVLARAFGPEGGLPPAALTGNLPNLVAARVAQSLDLTGPALAVDTACSSALVALHLARRSLQSGECDLAVVGGVNLALTSTGHRLLEQAGVLSPTGRCRAFGSEADGFVPGEGGAAIVLARLDDAHRADDPVLAVLRGTAVNNDGRSLSLLAPNALTQREIIVQAYRDAGVDPDSVSYVEAHGTGTALGDPVELRSLRQAFGPRADGRPRLLGSVKSNVGHLLNAAAMPGLIKVILALGHRELPASLHHDAPAADGDAEGFAVVGEHRAWTAPGPLVAGINAFGFGGTNAHAILEEAPPREHDTSHEREDDGPHLLTLSARSADALTAAARDLAAHLRAHPDLDEGDVCATVNTARDHGRHRLAVVSRGDLAERLAAHPATTVARSRPRLVFLLPGQGTVRPGAGRALYRSAPAFRHALDEASALIGPVCGRTLAQWCLDPDATPADLARTEVAQPLLVAYGVALARQLRAWGVGPDAVAGHSVGEITAACVAGALTLPEAVRFAAERGRLMRDLAEPGAMAAVRCGADALATVLDESAGALCVAAVNAPDQTVISGAPDAVDRAVTRLAAEGIPARALPVSHGFHSPAMLPVADPLAAAAAATLDPRSPSVPLLSSLTARWRPSLGPAHWREHALRPVRFGPAVERLLDDGYDTFVELGPGATLPGPVRSVAAGRDGADPAPEAFTLAAPDAGGDAAQALLTALGRLWTRGVELDHTALGAGRARVAVPTYPFQRRRYWPEPVEPEPVAAPLLHRLTWGDAPPSADGAPHAVRLAGPDSELARAVARRLERRGIAVQRGGDTAATEPPAPITVLLAGPAAADGAAVADVDSATHAVLSTLRDLFTPMSQDGARLVAVTEDVHATGVATERLRPAQALLTGLTLALPEEFPGLTAYSVDLSSYDSLDVRLDALEREVLGRHAPGEGGAVAWRAGRRLVRTLAPVPTVPPPSSPLPPDGTYLITGGTGGIGAALARDLAGRGRPTLVLVGRSARPADRLLAELGALGATAEYRVADVSAEADVEALMADLPPLDGVFHAAGVVRPGTLRTKSQGEMAEVMAAKVRGSQLLSRALWRHGHRPAVCVAFSSVAAVLPGLAGALGDYAAANAFLDAFAAAERAAGRPWQSLNFAAFAETGMAAGEPSRTAGEPTRAATVAARGPAPLATDAGLAALHTACGIDAAQLVVAELTVESAARVSAAATSPVDVAAAAGSAPALSAPATSAADRSAIAASGTDAAHSPVTDTLRRLLAEALHRAPADVDDDEPFLTMGLDSLSAVDLVRRLEAELGRALPPTLFFEYRTIRELAAQLSTGRGNAHPPHPTDDGTHDAFAAGAPLPLTPVQLAFHTGGRLHPEVAAYAYVRQTVSGAVDTELLGRALALLAERHPMLRIRIEPGGTAPTQRVTPPDPHTTPPWYEVRDADGGPPAELEEALCNRPFDLAAEAPVRAVLVRERADLAHLLLVLHHAAADGFSVNVLGEELWSVYTALAHGRSPELPPLQAGFADYATAVDAERSSPEAAEDRRYWHHLLADRTHPLDLPWDGDPDTPPAAPLTAHQVATDPDLTAALRTCAATHGVSLFHLLLAAYARCLARWSGQRAIAVNVARARRELRLAGLDRLVGPLADTLPLLATVDPDEPVPALAQRLRDIWLDAERHARLTGLDIARLLPATGSRPRTPSPAGFSFARFPVTADPDCPVTVRPAAARTASAATRLGLLCWESDGALHFSWNVPARLFAPATVERLAREHLAELTALTALTDSATPAPPPPAPERGGIVARLCARFRAAADQVAVDTGEATLTYAALDRASATLAARLRAHGVAPGDLVGLLTEPGADTVVGVVGILRAGAGWVPLDATHPTARLADQLHRTTARTVVCHAATRVMADAFDEVTAVALDDPSPSPDPAFVPAPDDPDAIAYTIFTSGSTGRPKAVPITHRAMVNYLDWAVDTFGYRAGDRLAQTASVCFDASVRQLLAPLLVGATVHTLPRNLVRDPEALLDRVVRDRITVWSSVPTLWERLLTAAETRVRRGAPRPDLSALRWIHVGGEVLPAAHVRRWYDLFGPGHRIANLYGPTETTINATCHLIDTRPGDEVRRLPIGRPISGTEVAVVAEDGRRCAPGEPGELLIGGTGLTPGYLGDPERTAAAFTERDGRRWYRSGDRVCGRPDGVLEFLGRLDDQVKVRGHRVEPGEIEAVLHTHPGVARAAVLHHHGRLTAFVEPLPGGPRPEPARLRAHLRGTLPDYMLPARFQYVEALPLTGTGKVDRRRLDAPAPDTATTAAAAEAPPATPTEHTLAHIWSEVLGVAHVSREDDFFALGGDSILVLEVFARLEKTHDAARRNTTLPRPTVIYEHSTLSALATAIDEATSAQQAPASPAGADITPYPLTPTQRGFLVAEAITPGSGSAWLARLRLRGPLRAEVFQRAVDALVVRHPMLRTVFPAGARPPVQQELPPALRLPVDFETAASPVQLDERVTDERRRRFEPWAWPLLRLRVLTLAPDEHTLVVHAHHLIGDGYSAALFGRELLTVYDRLARGEQPQLPPLRSTFRDYVTLLRQSAPDPAATAWRARHDAPYERPDLRRGDTAQAEFRSAGFTLDAETTAGLRHLATSVRATPYAPVLTAYYRALADLTGQRDLVLGLAVTGRDHALPDISRLFGPLAAAVPLRPAVAEADTGTDADTAPATSFRDDLRRVAEEATAARTYGTGGGPSGGDGHGLPRATQFLFSYLDFSALGPPTDGSLTLDWDHHDTELVPPPVGTDVFLAVRPVGDGLRVTVRASAAALDAAATEAFARALRDELAGAVAPRPRPRPRRSVPSARTDAALVGYLPAPGHLAALAGVPAPELPREHLRALLFPDGGPRLLEEISTPLGRSAFVSLPLFADELAPGNALTGHTARAVAHAASLGARCVSLAGMIPAYTGYGFEVVRATSGTTTVTTGHAATAVSVVKTVHAALAAAGHDLADLTVAMVGLGSIGTSSLHLLLGGAPRPPARLVLCDVAGSAPRLRALGAELRGSGLAGSVETAESAPDLPDVVYEADLIVTAVSGGTAVLDVDRLRAGTVVVDDSFPHCFDTARALDRMRGRRDVLTVGGGLLAVGDAERHIADDLPPAAASGYAEQTWLPGTVASCRLESLLHTAVPGLPLVHGLVDASHAHAYREAVEAAGVSAAPLHLLGHTVGDEG
ncbi:non-ribosomal peptide synthetase/type I polyketide synthase [Streptomyces sp. Rer75]|uniref:non-ribosomal peptide synthetase/type I polyketide synthase n=1 Tax=Streptomyces sp. Rer75 TaxID=2750011 RepID=UPI0015D002BF|nr:non-ribosomal peptide synthetase/type I polyketide synthase [Streptomyces sp. Rer75]QLH25716.1 amino acid adenylation domain-containing protein [Streptomyces sp. Rer75]